MLGHFAFVKAVPVQIWDAQYELIPLAQIGTRYESVPVLAAPEKNPRKKDRALVTVESRSQGQGPTLSGLDILKREDFARLKDKTIGLLINHSAIDKSGTHI